MSKYRLFFLVSLFCATLILPCLYSIAQAQTPIPAPPGRLQVLTSVDEPFVIKQEDHYTGFSVDLWDALAKRLNYSYDWVEVKSIDELLQRAQAGTADAGVGKIIITSEREKMVDFSAPYDVTGLRIMIGEDHRSFFAKLTTAIFRPGLLQLFGFFLLALLVIAHIIWLLERKNNDAIRLAYLPGLWDSLWYALSTLAALTYVTEDKPKSPGKQIIVMMMFVMGIILVTLFTAAITAELTVQELGVNINGPADLPGKKVATIQHSVAAKYLDQQGILYESVKTIDEAATLLEQGDVEAVVYDAPVLEYYAAHHGNGKVTVVGPPFNVIFYGIALPTGSPLRKSINEELMGMKEDGMYDLIYRKWFGAER
jgi:polar amino acid transport system substrate-binding protein